jgi:type I restriction enzyme S subunit
MAINQDVKALYPASGVSPTYLLGLMQFVQRYADAQAIGSTVKGIRIQDYLALPVPMAPTVEQPKISEILALLNTAIHKTEAIVEKLKQVKQGLLHDLLTRGVDASGELRPQYDEAPELYKESPLGWIPKEWEVFSLVNISTKITDGTHQAVMTVTKDLGNVPFLFVSCIRDGEIVLEKSAFITTRDYNLISKGREPVAGIVLYTAVGSYGHAAEASFLKDFAFQRHIACIYPFKSKVMPGFMVLFLNWNRVRMHADRVAIGNAQKTVTLSELSNFPFYLPPMNEQVEITSRFNSLKHKINQELLLIRKMKSERAALMEDLLTGRVRVTPLLKSA